MANESNFMWRCEQRGGEEEKQKKRTKRLKKEHKVLQLGYLRTLPKKILPLRLSGDCPFLFDRQKRLDIGSPVMAVGRSYVYSPFQKHQ
jgi:hypothetical protein